MRYLLSLVCVLALGLMGCGETSGTGGSAGDGGVGGDGGSGGNGGEMRPYVLRLSHLTEAGSAAPLAGVEVCEADTDNCVLSNEVGVATVRVPANQEVTITMEKEGYGSWITGDVSDETAELSTVRRMFTHAQLEAVAAQVGTSYPWQGGIVGLVRYPGQSAGATFTPVGSSVEAVGDSFYFDTTTGEYSTDLDETGSLAESYFAPLGDGGFTEVTPGEQEFQFGGTASNCQPSWAWPGSTPNSIRVPVREGFRTYGSMVCE